MGSEGNAATPEDRPKKRLTDLLCLAQAALVLERLYSPSNQDEQLLAKDPPEFDAIVEALTACEEKFAVDQGKNKEWEYGQILRILALLWYEAGEAKRGVTKQLPQRKENLELARKYYKKAIEVLEQKHPREIKVQKLRSSLASTLLELQRYQEALQVAQEAILLDALAYDNHEVLGDVYFERGDFEHAIEEWQEAILRRDTVMLASYGPELHVKIGKAYIKLARLHSELCLKEGKNQEAVNYMQQALTCCSNAHLKERLEIYYSLGYFYCALGEYMGAAKYLRLSRNFGFAPLTSTFYLGYAYLRNREYGVYIL